MANGMYSPSPDPFLQFRDSQGKPLSGGRLYTYAAGTSSPQTTYSDVGLTVPNPNPIVLSSDGTNPQGSVFLVPGESYRYVLQDANGNVIWVRDNIMVDSGGGSTPPPATPTNMVDQGLPNTDANSWPVHIVLPAPSYTLPVSGTVNQGTAGTSPWPVTGTVAVVQPVTVTGEVGGTPLPVTGTVAVSQPVAVSQSTSPWTVGGTVGVTQPVQVVGVSGGQPLPVSGSVSVSQPILVNQGAPAVVGNAWPVSIVSGGSGGGGGAVTVADGADVAQGTTTDATWSGTGAGTVVAVLKKIATGGSGGGPVTIADGANVTAGAKADTAATNSTSAWSVVALLKGLYALLNGNGKLSVTPVAGTPLSVTFPSAQAVTIPSPSSVTFPSAQLVTFPSAQPISGTVTANQGTPIADASSWPVHTVGAVTVASPLSVTFPSAQSVSVSNFPGTQPVSGTVSVGNFPSTQPVSGTVSVVQPIQVGPTAGTPLSVTFPSTQQVSVQNTPGVNQGTPAADVSSWPIHQIQTPGLQRISMSATGVGDNILVTGSAGNKVYVYGIWGVANGAMSIFFKDGASSGLTGTMALITSQQILLGTRVNPWFVTSTGNSFLINVSTGANLAGAIWFVIGP